MVRLYVKGLLEKQAVRNSSSRRRHNNVNLNTMIGKHRSAILADWKKSIESIVMIPNVETLAAVKYDFYSLASTLSSVWTVFQYQTGFICLTNCISR